MKSLRLGTLEWPNDPETALSALKPGHTFDVPELLFRKISDEERLEWQKRFSGRGKDDRPEDGDG